MAINWTVKDAIECLTDLTNPFVKKGIGGQSAAANQLGQKRALPNIQTIIDANKNNGGNNR